MCHGEDRGLTFAMTTRSFSFGLAATASPSFLYSGVRCLQCPHLRHAVQTLTACLMSIRLSLKLLWTQMAISLNLRLEAVIMVESQH